MEEFNKDLSELIKSLIGIVKDKEVTFKQTKYKHSDLNDILSFIKNNLNDKWTFFQPLRIENGKQILKTVLLHISSGKELTSEMIIPECQDPQKIGAIITYFRRYSLVTLLNLEAYDDEKELDERYIELYGVTNETLEEIAEAKNIEEIQQVYTRNVKKYENNNTLKTRFIKLCADKKDEILKEEKNENT